MLIIVSDLLLLLAAVVQEKDDSRSQNEGNDNWEDVTMPTVGIAAIDNGLAFPFKHPDEWRTCMVLLINIKMFIIFFSRSISLGNFTNCS